jgi:hypothetical protein
MPFRRKNVFEFSNYNDYRRKTLEPSFKGVVLDFLVETLMFNANTRRNFTYTIAKQRVLPLRGVFYMVKDFYLIDPLNRRLEQLKSYGIIDHLVERNLDLKKALQVSPAVKAVSSPSVLSVDNLRAAFQLWSYGICFCWFAFMCELIYHRMKAKCSCLKLPK